MVAGLVAGLVIVFASFIFALVNMAGMGGSAMSLNMGGFESGFKRHIASMIGFVTGMGIALLCGVLLVLEKLNH